MYRLWTVIPYASNASFYWPIDERSNVDWSIQEWRQFDKRRSTHCQLDARSIRALKTVFKTSSAFLEYRRFEARRAVVCCSLSLPLKSENCQERRLQVEHFTPSIPDAIYRLRKHERKRKFRYFGLKSRGIFTFRFASSRPFSFFLFSFLVLGI